jgi:hypothetical protein
MKKPAGHEGPGRAGDADGRSAMLVVFIALSC